MARKKSNVGSGPVKNPRNLRDLPEYAVWAQMIARCTHPLHPSYDRYGGRGIAVCERWRSSFRCFLSDMGRRPSDDHSLDRHPDNDGNYEPGNCRWTTWPEQCLNRSDNRRLEFNGENLCLSEWSKRIGISQTTLALRLDSGWSAEKTLTTPRVVRLSPGQVEEIRALLRAGVMREAIARRFGVNSGSIRWIDMKMRREQSQ